MPRVRRSRRGVPRPRDAPTRRVAGSGWGPRPPAHPPPEPDAYCDVFEDASCSPEEDGELDEDAVASSGEGDGGASQAESWQLGRSSIRSWRDWQQSRKRSRTRSRRRQEKAAVSEISRSRSRRRREKAAVSEISRSRSRRRQEKNIVSEIIPVPQDMFGRIIGRGGSVVMQIQEDSGARVDVNKGEAEVCISGSARCVAQAKEMMTKLIEDVFKERGGILERTMDVPEEHLGRIFGKRGQTIMKMQEESGAKINIHGCTVSIKGSTERITHAENLISELLADEKDEEPMEAFVDETIEVPRKDVGRVIGKGGQNVKKLQDESGANIQVDHVAEPPTVRIRGSADVVALAIDMISEIMYGWQYGDSIASAATVDCEVEETMEFPSEEAGRIIGPRGSTINGIRDQSGATIAVKNENTYCRLRVSGSADQVRLALDMIKAVGEGGGVKKKMELPLELAGRIIGKHGASIDELRQHSGAHIVVNKEPSCCIVALSGTDEQVLRAQNMIQAVYAKYVLDTQHNSIAGFNVFHPVRLPPLPPPPAVRPPPPRVRPSCAPQPSCAPHLHPKINSEED